MTEEVEMYVGMWNDWRRFNALPYEGDALDQPVDVYEALVLCETEHAKAMEEKSKEDA